VHRGHLGSELAACARVRLRPGPGATRCTLRQIADGDKALAKTTDDGHAVRREPLRHRLVQNLGRRRDHDHGLVRRPSRFAVARQYRLVAPERAGVEGRLGVLYQRQSVDAVIVEHGFHRFADLPVLLLHRRADVDGVLPARPRQKAMERSLRRLTERGQRNGNFLGDIRGQGRLPTGNADHGNPCAGSQPAWSDRLTLQRRDQLIVVAHRRDVALGKVAVVAVALADEGSGVGLGRRGTDARRADLQHDEGLARRMRQLRRFCEGHWIADPFGDDADHRGRGVTCQPAHVIGRGHVELASYRDDLRKADRRRVHDRDRGGAGLSDEGDVARLQPDRRARGIESHLIGHVDEAHTVRTLDDDLAPLDETA